MFSNPSTSPPLTEALTSPGQKTAKSKLLRLLSHGQKLEEEEEEKKEKPKKNCRQTDIQTDNSSLVTLGLRYDDCEPRICGNGFGNRSWKTMEKQIQAWLCVWKGGARSVVGAFRVSYGFAWDLGMKQQECAYVQALSKLPSPGVTLLLHSLTY